MPKEIAHDIKKRIQSMEKKSDVYIATNNENPRSRSIQAMRDATDDDGILTIESLEKELAKTGIGETSSQYLIGQAEVEGILVRHDAESWAWL